MPLNIEKIPLDIRFGWADAPEIAKDIPFCDVQNCPETPRYELYFGALIDNTKPSYRKSALEKYWWYVCQVHLDQICSLLKIENKEMA